MSGRGRLGLGWLGVDWWLGVCGVSLGSCLHCVTVNYKDTGNEVNLKSNLVTKLSLKQDNGLL